MSENKASRDGAAHRAANGAQGGDHRGDPGRGPRHLATDGAPALSLRAIARDLGMASSALYRYFKSRDELLTRLIIDAYDSLGAAAEAAEVAMAGTTWPVASPRSARRSGPGRWPIRTNTR